MKESYSDYEKITEAFYDALYIGRFLKTHDKKYKKSKKKIKKALKLTESGKFYKCLRNPEIIGDDDYGL